MQRYGKTRKERKKTLFFLERTTEGMAPLHKNKENALLKTEQYIFVLYF